jgi:hypothetical protein
MSRTINYFSMAHGRWSEKRFLWSFLGIIKLPIFCPYLRIYFRLPGKNVCSLFIDFSFCIHSNWELPLAASALKILLLLIILFLFCLYTGRSKNHCTTLVRKFPWVILSSSPHSHKRNILCGSMFLCLFIYLTTLHQQIIKVIQRWMA